jgi:hypothetical protein
MFPPKGASRYKAAADGTERYPEEAPLAPLAHAHQQLCSRNKCTKFNELPQFHDDLVSGQWPSSDVV